MKPDQSKRERCPHCGQARDDPAQFTDDSYSEFSCPCPFHYRPKEDDAMDDLAVYGAIQKFANLGPEEMVVHVCPACNKIVRGNYDIHEGRKSCTKTVHTASVRPVRYVRSDPA